MRYSTWQQGTQVRVGTETDGDMIDLLAPAFSSLLDVIDAERSGTPVAASGEVVSATTMRRLAPIPTPRRNLFCVGKNYRDHAEEFSKSGYDGSDHGADSAQPSHPIVFTKFPSTVIGPDDAVDLMAHITSKVDYEAELAVIIGVGGRDISAADALDHVWGYTAVNDVTARDRQQEHKQWLLGKSLDTFCPMGPVAVTADEIELGDTTVTCEVNGEVRQSANTCDLIFDVPTLIETISAGLTLEPGDIIATGTPAGVGIGLDPPTFLGPGDEVVVVIQNIGRLRNSFK